MSKRKVHGSKQDICFSWNTQKRSSYTLGNAIYYLSLVRNILHCSKFSHHSINILHKNLRIWFKIFLGCIYLRPPINSSNSVNTDQKYMLFFLAFGIRLNLPTILFKYLVEIIKEGRDIGSKHTKCIPIGRLISKILVESKLMESLILPKELEVEIGISPDRRNRKNTALIHEIIVLPIALDMTFVIFKRLIIEDSHASNSMELLILSKIFS